MMAKNKTFCIINRNDIDTRKEFGKYGMSMWNQNRLDCLDHEVKTYFDTDQQLYSGWSLGISAGEMSNLYACNVFFFKSFIYMLTPLVCEPG
jgi:hypothetical protein